MASNTDRIFMAEQIKVRDCNLSKHSSSNTASTTTLLSCSLLDNRCLLFKYNIFILSSHVCCVVTCGVCFLVCVCGVCRKKRLHLCCCPIKVTSFPVVVVCCCCWWWSAFFLFFVFANVTTSAKTHQQHTSFPSLLFFLLFFLSSFLLFFAPNTFPTITTTTDS